MEGRRSIVNRIVSISQPHVRPIVRGKVSSSTEFGAKISLSFVEGYTFIDRLSWEAFNESGDLKGQVKIYRQRFGRYPESVNAGKIYRSRDNRRFFKRHGIRLTGPQLDRPKKMVDRGKKKRMRQDELKRNAIERKFGHDKRRFGLGCIRAKLPET
jgi:hypothetical protein